MKEDIFKCEIIKHPTFKEKIKLLFKKEKHIFGEEVDYFYKEMNGKIYITREIIPEAIYRFNSDGSQEIITREEIIMRRNK